MHFVFLPGHCIPFHGKSLQLRPLGGTETGVIRLSEALITFGHEVSVVTEDANPPLTNPLYIPLSSIPFLTNVDVLIGVRDWRMALYPLRSKLRFFWTGDAYDQPVTIGLGDRRVWQKVDRFLAVSEWQAQSLCMTSGFPKEKTTVIRNGINLELFQGSEARSPKQLIYSSTPYRGLALLPEIFREIHARHPEASLQIFSGYGVYQSSSPTPQQIMKEYDVLCDSLTQLPNVHVHGNVLQSELARHFMRSAIFAYPNTFAETSCISAMEAMAGGAVPVTSSFAALPETIGDAGILVAQKPGSVEYIRSYIDAVDGLLQNPERLRELSEKCKQRAATFSWGHVGARLLNFIQEALSQQRANQVAVQAQGSV